MAQNVTCTTAAALCLIVVSTQFSCSCVDGVDVKAQAIAAQCLATYEKPMRTAQYGNARLRRAARGRADLTATSHHAANGLSTEACDAAPDSVERHAQLQTEQHLNSDPCTAYDTDTAGMESEFESVAVDEANLPEFSLRDRFSPEQADKKVIRCWNRHNILFFLQLLFWCIYTVTMGVTFP